MLPTGHRGHQCSHRNTAVLPPRSQSNATDNSPMPTNNKKAAAAGNARGSNSKRSKRQPANANLVVDEANNETNLEDYHFSEFFPHEELQTQRAAARRRSSDSLSASAAIVAAAAEAGNLSNSSNNNMILDPDLAGADASAAPLHDYHSQGSLDLMDRLNLDLAFNDNSPQFDTVKGGGRKGDRSSSISHLHKQSGGLTASRRELHLSDSDTFASANASGTLGGTSSSSHRDDDRTSNNNKQSPAPPTSQAIASADSRRITRRGRRRSTSNPDLQLQLGDSKNSSGTFEVADSTDDDASARNKKGQEEKGEGKKRRVSDFSLASMMLLMPNMDDFSAKGEKDQKRQQKQEDQNEGSELKQHRPRGRDRRSRKAWGSAGDNLPDSKAADANEDKAHKIHPSSSASAVGAPLDIGMNDVADRWNQVARSSEQHWTEQSFRYKTSRSLSPYSRGLVGNLPPGNLEPNSSGRVSIRSELSDNDTSTLRSSDETGRESDHKKEGGGAKKRKPKDTKINRPDQAGLQGLWLVLPKRLRKRQRSDVKESENSRDKDDDASLSPSDVHQSSTADLERGSIGPGGLVRSKSKREIRREQAELNASKVTLTGQGKLGDQMVMGREIKQRKIILRCCLILIGLVVMLVIPILLSVPGFQDVLPPRLAEVVDNLIHRVQGGISYASENFHGSGQQLDDLGRPIDPSTGLPIGMEIEETIDNVRSRVPLALRNMVDVGAAVDEGRGLARAPASPLIWDLDYSGSKALEQIFADCLGMRVASNLGGDENNQLYARESVSLLLLCHRVLLCLFSTILSYILIFICFDFYNYYYYM